jgi:hypothetical protein
VSESLVSRCAYAFLEKSMSEKWHQNDSKCDGCRLEVPERTVRIAELLKEYSSYAVEVEEGR